HSVGPKSPCKMTMAGKGPFPSGRYRKLLTVSFPERRATVSDVIRKSVCNASKSTAEKPDIGKPIVNWRAGSVNDRSSESLRSLTLPARQVLSLPGQRLCEELLDFHPCLVGLVFAVGGVLAGAVGGPHEAVAGLRKNVNALDFVVAVFEGFLELAHAL